MISNILKMPSSKSRLDISPVSATKKKPKLCAAKRGFFFGLLPKEDHEIILLNPPQAYAEFFLCKAPLNGSHRVERAVIHMAFTPIPTTFGPPEKAFHVSKIIPEGRGKVFLLTDSSHENPGVVKFMQDAIEPFET